MPMTPYLRGQSFDPEAIEAMGAAFAQVCDSLRLTDCSDKLTEVVACHIVEMAQRWVQTKTALYLSAMQEFKASPQ